MSVLSGDGASSSKTIQALKNKIRDLEHELTVRRDEYQKDIDGYKSELKQLKEKLSEEKGKRREAEEISIGLKKELEDGIKREEELEGTVEILAEQKKKLLEEKDSVLRNMKEKNSTTAQYIEALEKADDRIEELEKENEEVKSDLIQKVKENAYYKDVVDRETKSKKEFSMLKDQNADLLSKLSSVEGQFQTLYSEGNPSQTIAELKSKIGELQKKCSAMEDELISLRRERAMTHEEKAIKTVLSTLQTGSCRCDCSEKLKEKKAKVKLLTRELKRVRELAVEKFSREIEQIMRLRCDYIAFQTQKYSKP